MIRRTATGRPIWRALLALVVLGGVLLALSTDPADAATTFTVNKTGDAADMSINGVCDASGRSGNQCTLRATIQEANANNNDATEVDVINFAIGGRATVKTINVGSTGLGALPDITEAVTINGYTQRGSRANTLAEGNDARLKVQLNGANAEQTGGASGLEIFQASNSTIKGLVINRFNAHGIIIRGSDDTQFNKVEGNFIGTNAKGTTDLGNGGLNRGNGVTIISQVINGVPHNVTDNTIGGTASGAGNVISANGDDGVLITGSGATGNSVLSNFIFSNGGLGIDLVGTDGVTANDTDDDSDTGANNRQNFPVISSAIKSSNPSTNFTTITGTLNSDPNQTYTIQCFMTGPGPFAAEKEDPSGHGEGQFPVGEDTVTTDAGGEAEGADRFSCVSPIPQVGQAVTVTATNTATGDTSEFSLNKTVVAGP